ncbi:S26 family signal peptidase [Duganella vulcania]|uniref:Peptidase S26 n=1 Tax=Duganella vulcania TaxID=2692166 RepID=A0A845GGR8_9BURK|nr:S26 family signal peptidase [Duganella vulcania]MYM92710.1 peptidase S26 [Duganella vulcania]
MKMVAVASGKSSGFASRITPANIFGLLRLMCGHLARLWLAYLMVAGCLYLFNGNYEIAYNRTHSLPYQFFLIHYGEPVQRGDFIAFRWNGSYPYKKGQVFVKIAAGVAGDEVTRVGQEFFVAGQSVGSAKPFGLRGQPLEASGTGTIGPYQYYVKAPHKDSLDSRYAMLGLVKQSDVVGRAYVIF